MVLGGRYDGVGAAFGRARPATGFSLDIRELCQLATLPLAPAAIFAAALPVDANTDARDARAQAIQRLREQGERVIDALPGEMQTPGVNDVLYSGSVCDRVLVLMQGKWIVQAS